MSSKTTIAAVAAVLAAVAFLLGTGTPALTTRDGESAGSPARTNGYHRYQHYNRDEEWLLLLAKGHTG
jgi:hypothetical protein